jgi:hypothetical protein
VSTLPDPAPISYNGVTFATETETVEIAATPRYDSTGRTVSYIEYDLTLRALIYGSQANGTGNASNDGNMQTLRVLLQQPGGALVYQNRGFGNLNINVAGPRDVVWGPKPKLLRWKPDGANNSAWITWRVTVAIPECPNNAAYRFALMEFVYKLSFRVDRSGMTTRVYSGHLAIPQTRNGGVNGRLLSDNADKYREQIFPQYVPGFRRIPGDFTLSEDKCRLEWSITDEQMGPNCPPAGMTEAKAEHSVSAPTGLIQWTAQLSAEYDLAPGTSGGDAARAFSALWHSRLIATLRNARIGGQAVNLASYVITGFTMREPEIYGKVRKAAFKLTYTFTTDRKTAFLASGLWLPVNPLNQSWTVWNASMTGTGGPLGPRGSAGMGFVNSDDVLVDLCAQPSTPVNNNSLVPSIPPEVMQELRTPTPAPNSSWLLYLIEIITQPRDNVSELKALPLGPAVYEATPTSPADRSGFRPPYRQGVLSNFQYRSSPRQVVILRGRALRAGYPITPPQLVAVGGQPAVPANGAAEYFRTGVVTNYGVPVVAAEWRFRYLLPDTPQLPVLPPSNPFLAAGATTSVLTTADGLDSGVDPGQSVLTAGGYGGLPFPTGPVDDGGGGGGGSTLHTGGGDPFPTGP